MSDSGQREDLRLGFLASIEDQDRGVVGGLLITNRFGRPLEFQCTTPVKANRTQEILYGETLRPYLMGEVIGRTLVEKVAVKPHLVLTEDLDLLSLRDHLPLPVACVAKATKESLADNSILALGKQVLRFHQGHADDRKSLERQASQIPSSADLQEPFERVREALQETMKLAAPR